MIAYAITDSSTLDFDNLESSLARFATKSSMIVYRDKSTKKYVENAIVFLTATKMMKKYFDKVLLHSDYLLAHRLGADGVHLQSTQLSDIAKAKALNLFVIVSTHTLKEAKEAEICGADMLTYSPIFSTPNKGKEVGLEGLKHYVSSVDIPVIALGGVLTRNQIDACERSGAKGFGSIRFFA